MFPTETDAEKLSRRRRRREKSNNKNLKNCHKHLCHLFHKHTAESFQTENSPNIFLFSTSHHSVPLFSIRKNIRRKKMDLRNFRNAFLHDRFFAAPLLLLLFYFFSNTNWGQTLNMSRCFLFTESIYQWMCTYCAEFIWNLLYRILV